jgi:hypothetical protein
MDGEAVVLCLDGMPDFDALHSGKHNAEVQSVPSTCWRLMATTYATCRYRCARPIWSACCAADQTAFS